MFALLLIVQKLDKVYSDLFVLILVGSGAFQAAIVDIGVQSTCMVFVMEHPFHRISLSERSWNFSTIFDGLFSDAPQKRI